MIKTPNSDPAFLAAQGFSPTFPQRFWSKVNKNGPVPAHCPELGPCWVWTAGLVGGYGQVRPNQRDACIRSHRASWVMANGSISDGLWVLHHCDNPACVNPAHLWLGTAIDNKRDCMRKNRHAKTHSAGSMVGEDHPLSKLTWKAVESIRRRHARRESTIRGLSTEYGVTFQAVWCVLKRKTWIKRSTESPPSSTRSS